MAKAKIALSIKGCATPKRYQIGIFWWICQYFSVFTISIPTENSVGRFRYQKGGNCPLFPSKEGKYQYRANLIPGKY